MGKIWDVEVKCLDLNHLQKSWVHRKIHFDCLKPWCGSYGSSLLRSPDMGASFISSTPQSTALLHAHWSHVPKAFSGQWPGTVGDLRQALSQPSWDSSSEQPCFEDSPLIYLTFCWNSSSFSTSFTVSDLHCFWEPSLFPTVLYLSTSVVHLFPTWHLLHGGPKLTHLFCSFIVHCP